MNAPPFARSCALMSVLALSACAPGSDAPATETNIGSRQQGQAIVRGEPVVAGVYPWMVYANGCTASLISSRYVLLAAHCLAQNRNDAGTLEGVEITSPPVQTGDPDRDSSRMVSVDVTDVFIHPGYLPLTVEETFGLEPYDVALLELSEPVVLERYLRLPTRSPRAGESVIVAGWGVTETGLPSTVLREAVLTVQDDADCYVGDGIRFCTMGNAINSNVGSGDSGGPVFVDDGDGFMVLGTNSAATPYDYPDPIALHARIVPFVPWILSIAGEEFACTEDGTGEVCEADIDECALGVDACGPHGTCENTVGGFTCACEPGYVLDGSTCVDVDECAQDAPCGASEECVNTEGDFACVCAPGFTLESGACVDVNECATSSPCAGATACVNTLGAFECVAFDPSPAAGCSAGPASARGPVGQRALLLLGLALCVVGPRLRQRARGTAKPTR